MRIFGLFMILMLSVQAVVASPNILLVIADDMGLDASPCHAVGNSAPAMPNLQALCAAGTVFDNAYSAPTCSPTRATILTGKYGFRTGIGGAITPGNDVSLSPDETSLFDVLNAGGYASAVIGKWHLAGSDAGLSHPASLGVTDFFGIYSGAAKDYYNFDIVENGGQKTLTTYATTAFTDRAINWIAQQDAPWLLWLAYNAPHAPFHAPPAALHQYGNLSVESDAIRADQQTYYNAALQALDSEFGRLLGSLSPETRDETIVIFIGDNGTPSQVVGDIYGTHGAKGGIYEGGTHVPLIVSGPAVKTGRSEALVNTTDLFATITTLAGLSAKSRDSIDFSPALTGQQTQRRHVYVEHFSDQAPRGKGSLGQAIRDARYKLVAEEGRAPALFDLKADPFEQTDLLANGGSITDQSIAAGLISAMDEIKN